MIRQCIGSAAAMLMGAAVLNAQSSYQVRATNALAIGRVDETIAIPWADVVAKLPQASPTKVRVVDHRFRTGDRLADRRQRRQRHDG